MARGDVNLNTAEVGAQVEILRRTDFEGVTMTLDFSSVNDTDKETGKKIVKAGTPIDGKGVPQKTTPWTGAVGILLHDVYEVYPHGTILKKAYIDKDVAETHSECTYDETLYGLFPMIVFEDTGKE